MCRVVGGDDTHSVASLLSLTRRHTYAKLYIYIYINIDSNSNVKTTKTVRSSIHIWSTLITDKLYFNATFSMSI